MRLVRFLAIGLLGLGGSLASTHADPSVVKVVKGADGTFQLLRNGHPFFIKGAGGNDHLDLLQQAGGNSLRTWGIETLGEGAPGPTVLEQAEKLDLAVTAGIWLQHAPGFDYADPKQLEAQRQQVRDAVTRYKDSPALLIWGLGNEMEGTTSDGDNPALWQEINYLAGMIKQLDPNHPVMTVLAGAGAVKVHSVAQYCPNIDILGINAYGSAPGVGKAVTQAGWDRPFLLTEFGPLGQWEVSQTPWGAPIEPTSTEKAASYYATEKNLTADFPKTCLGTYAFLWGNKQEATATWYGMFLPDGSKVGPVDAISFAWTGQWPDKRCPLIRALPVDLTGKQLAAGSDVPVQIIATDPNPNSGPLQYQWELMAESTVHGIGGSFEATPQTLAAAVTPGADGSAIVHVPAQKGAYRLFVYVRNAYQAAATANMPFQAN